MNVPETSLDSATTETALGFITLRLTAAKPARSLVQTIPAEPRWHRTLKVALAMKGGVSLAVWIGGAVAELDVLRRIRIVGDKESAQAFLAADANGLDVSEALLERADIYARALSERCYDRVEFDVLAGASAGGLNGILYAVAQRTGASVDRVLDTWIDYGAIWKLLRPGGFRGVLSVLSGDFFWNGVNTAINEMYDHTNNNKEHVAADVSLDLSATIRDPDYRSSLERREGRGHFHFLASRDPGAFVVGRDIPDLDHGGTAAAQRSMARLAYAARTTSSFPGAFEPALIPSIVSTRPRALGEELDMRYAFSAHRKGADRPFRVFDGGVLDNIPIDRIARALRARVPDTYSARMILYLDPSPDADDVGVERAEKITPPPGFSPMRRTTTQPRSDVLSRFLDTIRAGVSMRGIRENGVAEVGDLHLYRQSLYLRTARAEAYTFAGPDQIDDTARRDLHTGYVRYRIAADVAYLMEVLSDPDLWQLGTDLPTRASHVPIPVDRLQALDNELVSAVLAGTPQLETTEGTEPTEAELAAHDAELLSGKWLGGSRAALDSAMAGLEWLRLLEKNAFRSGTDISPAPYWAERAVARDDLLAAASIARRDLEVRTAALLLRLRKAGKTAGQKAARIASEWVAAEGSRADLADAWAKLDSALPVLVRQSRELDDWESPWRKFGDSDIVTAQDMGPYAAVTGIPDPTYAIRYTTITGSEDTPLISAFAPLRVAQLATTAEAWMARRKFSAFKDAARAENRPHGLDDSAKLAGSTLGNFGAFLSSDWRRNDWWWGRLDAAAGILRIIDSLPTLGTPATPLPAPENDRLLATRRKKAQELLLTQAARSGEQSPIKAAENLSAAEIARKMTGGSEALDNLRERYVLSVASRLTRVGVRAIRTGLRALPKTLVTLMLPPLLVAAPLVAAPSRALFAGMSLAVGLNLIWRRESDPWPGTWVVVGIAITLVALGLYRVVEAAQRRRLVRKVVPELTHRIRLSNWTSWTGIVLSLACLGAAIWLVRVMNNNLSATTWLLLVAAVVAGIGSGVAGRKLPAGGTRVVPNLSWGALSALAAAFVVVSGLMSIAPERAAGPDPSITVRVAVTMAITIAVVTATLGAGWLTTGGRGFWPAAGRIAWLALVSALTGAGGGVMVWVITNWFPGNVVFTPPALCAIAAWFVASHVFWWLSEVPVYSLDPSERDRAVPRVKLPANG